MHPFNMPSAQTRSSDEVLSLVAERMIEYQRKLTAGGFDRATVNAMSLQLHETLMKSLTFELVTK